MITNFDTLICGAGPAGLTAAHQLVTKGHYPLVLEQLPLVGGIARTETYKGYRFDIGGHRFFSKDERINRLWRGMLGEDFITRSRLSHIYYKGKFFNYPIDISNALANLGIWESFLVVMSYFRIKISPLPEIKTFEDWVTNHFGYRLYRMFFKTYTEKVWGIPCHEIHAEWAAQRIKGLSLTAVVANALLGTHRVKTLATEFFYPSLGPGMMWERFAEVIRKGGGDVWCKTKVMAVRRRSDRVTGVVVQRNGKMEEYPAQHIISSMPLKELISCLDPLPHAAIVDAARQLSYRSFLIVGLVLRRDDIFRDQWIYVHSTDVKVGRIQNFREWSPLMVPDISTVSLGLEYFCTEGDAIWRMGCQDLVSLAARELEMLGLAHASEVMYGVVLRQPKAYPVYDDRYQANLEAIRDFLAGIPNLHSIGRNGMHCYNNMDHSMLTGMMAADNVLGATHDIWAVNHEPEYHEEQRIVEPDMPA